MERREKRISCWRHRKRLGSPMTRSPPSVSPFERANSTGSLARRSAVHRPYAIVLVQQALGERALSEATSLTISGHWQQLNAIGDALHACTSLTELDLSRNGLASLDGLQSLRRLRKLSVYYNVVSRLPELDRLRCHPDLELLDLRLNPVTHAGRRHRLRALCAVPSITLLDGRDVTGAERAQAQKMLSQPGSVVGLDELGGEASGEYEWGEDDDEDEEDAGEEHELEEEAHDEQGITNLASVDAALDEDIAGEAARSPSAMPPLPGEAEAEAALAAATRMTEAAVAQAEAEAAALAAATEAAIWAQAHAVVPSSAEAAMAEAWAAQDKAHRAMADAEVLAGIAPPLAMVDAQPLLLLQEGAEEVDDEDDKDDDEAAEPAAEVAAAEVAAAEAAAAEVAEAAASQVAEAAAAEVAAAQAAAEEALAATAHWKAAAFATHSAVAAARLRSAPSLEALLESAGPARASTSLAMAPPASWGGESASAACHTERHNASAVDTLPAGASASGFSPDADLSPDGAAAGRLSLERQQLAEKAHQAVRAAAREAFGEAFGEGFGNGISSLLVPSLSEQVQVQLQQQQLQLLNAPPPASESSVPPTLAPLPPPLLMAPAQEADEAPPQPRSPRSPPSLATMDTPPAEPPAQAKLPPPPQAQAHMPPPAPLPVAWAVPGATLPPAALPPLPAALPPPPPAAQPPPLPLSATTTTSASAAFAATATAMATAVAAAKEVDAWESHLPSAAAAAAAVGPTMAAAVAAAEERWTLERARLLDQIDELRQQRAADDATRRTNEAMVTMLQETHASLVASNEHLLGEVWPLPTASRSHPPLAHS